MAQQDVERFVGLLVSDEKFAKDVKKNFDATITKNKINLDKRETAILKEGINIYLEERTVRGVIGRGGTVAVPAAAAVGAAVAGAVAAEVATKVVDKLFSSKFVTPVNMRIRDLMIARNVITK